MSIIQKGKDNYMSKVLDELIEYSRRDMIEDPVEAEKIIQEFCNQPINDFKPDKSETNYYTPIIREIADGYEIVAEKLEKASFEEIAYFIRRAPGYEDFHSEFESGRYVRFAYPIFIAGNVAGMILMSKSHNYLTRQVLKISLKTFIDLYKEKQKLSGRATKEIKDGIEVALKNKSEEIKTVGDALELFRKYTLRPYYPGIRSVEQYGDDMKTVYSAIHGIVVTCFTEICGSNCKYIIGDVIRKYMEKSELDDEFEDYFSELFDENKVV